MTAVEAVKEAVRRPLHLLRTAPRELWLVYALKVLDSYGYFALSEVFTLLLTDEFGINDVTAGAYYGAWGTAITLYGILTGFLIDAMGVRTSLVVGFYLKKRKNRTRLPRRQTHAHGAVTPHSLLLCMKKMSFARECLLFVDAQPLSFFYFFPHQPID